jgi:hypothetical protein
MIIEVERGINKEISHLRAGMPPVPGIPNFVMEKKQPKVANGKEEFVDNVETNAEADFEQQYDDSDEEEELAEIEEKEKDSIENIEETQKPVHVFSSKTKIETENVDEPFNIEANEITENNNISIWHSSTNGVDDNEIEDYDEFLEELSSYSNDSTTRNITLRTQKKEQAMIKDIFDVDVEVDDYAGYEFEPDHEIRREKEILKAEVENKIKRLKEQKQAEIDARIAQEEKLQKIREDQLKREKVLREREEREKKREEFLRKKEEAAEVIGL